MPLTITSTAITEVKNTQTIYPTCFIRNAADLAAYLDHADPEDQKPNQVRLNSIERAKVWKLDKDDSSLDLLVSSAARGAVLTHHQSDVLILDDRRESTRKWRIEKADAARFRLSGTTFEIEGKYWTLDSTRNTVSLEDPVGKDASEEDQLKQQWAFETAPFA